jgi:16S rRNA (uracil1498-N3)-methyltransferase
VHEPRFYCPHIEPGVARLDAAESRHALLSLRLKPGVAVVLFDGCGRVGYGRLADPGVEAREPDANRKHRRTPPGAAVYVERVLLVPPPARTLTLVCPGCKGDRLDWLVEKCTELGVTTLRIAQFARSVVQPGETRIDKLRRSTVEAGKQSRRAWLPEITAAMPLAEAVASAPQGGLIVADPDEQAPSLASWLHGHALNAQHLAAVVGPEGGITADEMSLLRARGAQIVRLADQILRVETAAVAIAANWAARGGV